MMTVGERVSPRTAPNIGDPYIALFDQAALQACASERAGLGRVIEQFAGESQWNVILRNLAATTRAQFTLVTGRVVTGTLVECGLDYVLLGQVQRDVVVRIAAISSASLLEGARARHPAVASVSAVQPRDRELIEMIDRYRQRDEVIAVELATRQTVTGTVSLAGHDVVEICTGSSAPTWMPVAHIVTVSGTATAAEAY